MRSNRNEALPCRWTTDRSPGGTHTGCVLLARSSRASEEQSHHDERVLVIGDGTGAVQAALELFPESRVTLSTLRGGLGHVEVGLRLLFFELVAEGELTWSRCSYVERLTSTGQGLRVDLRDDGGEQRRFFDRVIRCEEQAPVRTPGPGPRLDRLAG